MGDQIAPCEGAIFRGKDMPGHAQQHCGELCKNGLTDRHALWVVESGFGSAIPKFHYSESRNLSLTLLTITLLNLLNHTPKPNPSNPKPNPTNPNSDSNPNLRNSGSPKWWTTFRMAGRYPAP